MTTKATYRRHSARIVHSRWAAYASAATASALASAATAEANITYSGLIDQHFSGDAASRFPLEGHGSYLNAYHLTPGEGVSYGAIFAVRSATPPFLGAAIAGVYVAGGVPFYRYASKLTSGQNISTRPFVSESGVLAAGSGLSNAQWLEPGTGFLGFRFDAGAGVQYGWARVNLEGGPEYNFTLIDYAFADPGERITAGQTGTATVPESGGSLGLLAIGCAGLLAWRAWRGEKPRARRSEVENPAMGRLARSGDDVHKFVPPIVVLST